MEIREQVESHELNEFLVDTWPGVEHVFCLKRAVHRQSHLQPQTVYSKTRRSLHQAGASQMLE